jgi:hypothetical protein
MITSGRRICIALLAVAGCGGGGRAAAPDAANEDPQVDPDTGVAADRARPMDGPAAGKDTGAAPSTDGPPRPDAAATSTNRAEFGLAGPSLCAGSGLLVCENFENGAADPTVWTGRASVVDTIHAARGSKAWHIKLATGQASFLTNTKIFPAPNNTYYGRMFVYFTSIVTGAYTHWTMVQATGTGLTSQIRLGGQTDLWGVGSFAGPTGDWTRNDNDPAGKPRHVPLGEWMCIEWMHDGANNETRFFWDGVDHESLHTTPTKHSYGNGGTATAPYNMPMFNKVQLGWAEYQIVNGGLFELWIDEIALDSQRIGCVR